MAARSRDSARPAGARHGCGGARGMRAGPSVAGKRGARGVGHGGTASPRASLRAGVAQPRRRSSSPPGRCGQQPPPAPPLVTRRRDSRSTRGAAVARAARRGGRARRDGRRDEQPAAMCVPQRRRARRTRATRLNAPARPRRGRRAAFGAEQARDRRPRGVERHLRQAGARRGVHARQQHGVVLAVRALAALRRGAPTRPRSRARGRDAPGPTARSRTWSASPFSARLSCWCAPAE